MIPGAEMKKLRKAAGLTQQELGDIIGIGKQAVGKYEKEKLKDMPSDRIQRLAVAFGVTPAYLMGWEEKRRTDEELLALAKKYEDTLISLDDMPEPKRNAHISLIGKKSDDQVI